MAETTSTSTSTSTESTTASSSTVDFLTTTSTSSTTMMPTTTSSPATCPWEGQITQSNQFACVTYEYICGRTYDDSDSFRDALSTKANPKKCSNRCDTLNVNYGPGTCVGIVYDTTTDTNNCRILSSLTGPVDNPDYVAMIRQYDPNCGKGVPSTTLSTDTTTTTTETTITTETTSTVDGITTTTPDGMTTTTETTSSTETSSTVADDTTTTAETSTTVADTTTMTTETPEREQVQILVQVWKNDNYDYCDCRCCHHIFGWYLSNIDVQHFDYTNDHHLLQWQLVIPFTFTFTQHSFYFPQGQIWMVDRFVINNDRRWNLDVDYLWQLYGHHLHGRCHGN
ncbi:hypothetical protein LTR41_007673 [Exophiala xenobiotica]|nr:hypothetical protein LTR41_007673 [Exophiala xenobiotica]